MNKDLTWNASDNKDRESTERTSRENGPVTVELLEALRDGDHEAYKTVYCITGARSRTFYINCCAPAKKPRKSRSTYL